ncbi:MAG TPA: anti-sigma factor [Gaiellaceae bacterium]|nr:anti-sigma factor [Gaiellaceae bacterium]
MAGSSRAESARRLVELTGLGIAATYFLDPALGARRRRAAWSRVAGARSEREARELTPATLELHTVEPEPLPPEPPEPPAELVLIDTERSSPDGDRHEEAQWPGWGWPLVLTITACAVVAFAAVGLGIWAIEHRTPTARTVTTPSTAAAPVLADPTARRVVGEATRGSILLRLNPTGAALAVDGLPPLPPRARYRVWIRRTGTTTPAGTFAGQRAILALRPLASGSRVTITREPSAASAAAPRGPLVASAIVP